MAFFKGNKLVKDTKALAKRFNKFFVMLLPVVEISMENVPPFKMIATTT